MRKQSLAALGLLSILCWGSPLQLQASKSKPFSSQEEADIYLTSHYNRGCYHYNRQEWRRASTEFEKVIYFFSDSDAAADAAYYLAICYFEMKEYDFANTEFSNYLKASNQPAFFEDAVQYKFCIAEHFKLGKKRRYFKIRYCPKWATDKELALTIYDEVVAALPNHELTVRALYSKADLLKRMEEYRDCVETYQILIRRFPKNEIVPACYINIAEAFYLQSRYEFQNPDLLALAELNARKFQEDFPRDERVVIAEDYVKRIKELYAKGLCDLGLFYERMKQPAAAAIYYQSSIEEFPDTCVSQFCRSRLICLGYTVNQDEEEAPVCGEGGIDYVPEENQPSRSPCETDEVCLSKTASFSDDAVQDEPVNAGAPVNEMPPEQFNFSMSAESSVYETYSNQQVNEGESLVDEFTNRVDESANEVPLENFGDISGYSEALMSEESPAIYPHSYEVVDLDELANQQIPSGYFDTIPGSFEVPMPQEPITYIYPDQVYMDEYGNQIPSGYFDAMSGSFEVPTLEDSLETYTYPDQEVSQAFVEEAMMQGVPLYLEEQEKQEEIKEVPPTYIHYSLLKKREQKCKLSSCYED